LGARKLSRDEQKDRKRWNNFSLSLFLGSLIGCTHVREVPP
jgi:hypothetical protein